MCSIIIYSVLVINDIKDGHWLNGEEAKRRGYVANVRGNMGGIIKWKKTKTQNGKNPGVMSI